MTSEPNTKAMAPPGAKRDLGDLPPISLIIPAFNEERYIPETLARLRAAAKFLKAYADTGVQLLVVDNGSTDRTAAIAEDCGATVIREPDHNIAKVRNVGARAADHDVLIFLDADTLVPPQLLLRIAQVMSDPACVGGAVDVAHPARRPLIRAYLKLWRAFGMLGGMAQGACQFCRREIFGEIGGYDESLYMGEDVDFFWRLRAIAQRRALHALLIRDLRVIPSARRFDKWPLWRTLVWTNPFLVFALRRRRSPWAGWYGEAPR